jgi:hypothetical protein
VRSIVHETSNEWFPLVENFTGIPMLSPAELDAEFETPAAVLEVQKFVRAVRARTPTPVLGDQEGCVEIAATPHPPRLVETEGAQAAPLNGGNFTTVGGEPAPTAGASVLRATKVATVATPIQTVRGEGRRRAWELLGRIPQ